MKQRTRLGLPLLLGSLSFSLILLALWPQETPHKAEVVAARDLGAGHVLAASDLTILTLPVEQIPPEAISDPTALVGQMLAVPRFQGEAVQPRHLGPQLNLQPGERAVALEVERDQGLGGTLQPGMRVGVVATLADASGATYAQALLSDLRVLYVSPEFQARAPVPASAAMQVRNGESTSSSVSSGSTPARQGIVILAVPVAPQLLSSAVLSGTLPLTTTLSIMPEQQAVTVTSADRQGSVRWVNAVELLAALNHEDHAFTLVLQPDGAMPYPSSGLSLRSLLPTPAPEEAVP